MHAPQHGALALARARAKAGLPVTITDLPGRAVHRDALALAVELGAPLAPVLAVVEEVARADDELVAAVRRASAEGRAVAVGLVVAPPLLGLAAGALVADQPLAWAVTPVGRALLLVAATLWLAGALAVWVAVRRAARPPPGDDEAFVLAATAIRAGEPLPQALRRAGAVLAGGDRRPQPARGPPGVGDLEALALWLELGGRAAPPASAAATWRVLAAGVTDGVALAPLLDELGRRARSQRRDLALERAARLGARLSLPTALLLLPAGLLLAAGPLLLGALTSLT